jgi:phosphate transport system permease protein
MRNIWKSGEPFIWLTGGALAIGLIMVVSLVLLIMVNGLGFFWPKDVVRLTLDDGSVIMGQVIEREKIPQYGADAASRAEYRLKVKQGNRPLFAADFVWIDEAKIASREWPADALVVERTEWGNMYGTIQAVKDGPNILAEGSQDGWTALTQRLPESLRVSSEIRRIEDEEIGAINYAQEKIRLKLRKLELQGVTSGAQVDRHQQAIADWQAKYGEHQSRINELRTKLSSSVVVALADGQEHELPLSQIVRVYRPNSMGPLAKSGFYASKLWEFVSADPRESNTEGGVFPAIFGTVMMVLIMSIVVTPLGVLAALYLREYAKQGPFVSAVRIAVNNLAGVPSIVFGVFGVGFFIYIVGGSIDRAFFPEALPTPTFGTGGILWASLTLALMTVPVVIVATEEGLAAIPRGMREASLALGATKFETTWRVVLPAVMPSIMTGLILAMARAAGEVAPLMITGVVKLAPALPMDGNRPFFHLDRKFMHLGFHIYDVGFQSPNVDAARPMVYATAFLLLVIVVLLNLTAITLRNRLRKKYATPAV